LLSLQGGNVHECAPPVGVGASRWLGAEGEQIATFAAIAPLFVGRALRWIRRSRRS
jgi:hypothetical protein